MNEKSKPLIIGLAGPSCAGKNAAGSILEKMGFTLIDADKVAHAVLAEKKDEVLACFLEIAKERRINLLDAQGELDRKALGRLLFADAKLLRQHEALIYPRLTEIIKAMIYESDGQTRGVLINAALLYKTPLLELCAFVFYIDAPYPVRFLRALKRDKQGFVHIFRRFLAQKDLYAQYILKDVDILKVNNFSSLKVLEKKLCRVLHQGFSK